MGLFVRGPFIAHSGKELDFKIECDALTKEDIETLAYIISKRVSFGHVMGVPEGGLRLQNALDKYITKGPTLLVDDVLTTGQSIENLRRTAVALGEAKFGTVGYVIFARGPLPKWVHALFITAA